ncbi:hypothetical protein RUMGNA_00592 [Mediterraneibacter gnavus ATCC 29149]|uniref:Uncharacterized protein n=1 Tax=Mediterraneibacter gnavus (strain ATCC 29149 / DSM 114966 / JCM 6515 / VPI C7-9) TaxID=411470 RepID=A7AZ76_MEDG7|nr:hypothetical protein RUMGNA_00592 [Mediterraneibacter gnavus ATCC 29149]
MKYHDFLCTMVILSDAGKRVRQNEEYITVSGGVLVRC